MHTIKAHGRFTFVRLFVKVICLYFPFQKSLEIIGELLHGLMDIDEIW